MDSFYKDMHTNTHFFSPLSNSDKSRTREAQWKKRYCHKCFLQQESFAYNTWETRQVLRELARVYLARLF